MMRGARMHAAIVMLASAGCLGNGPGPTAPGGDGVADPLQILDAALPNGHDHADPALHPGASWRIRDVFSTYLPMRGQPHGPPSEFSIHGHHAFVATFVPAAGFSILDITDPARPVEVGFYSAGTAYTNDVEISPDGRWAFVPTQPYYRTADPLGPGLPVLSDAGVQIVDIADLSNPRMAGFYWTPDPDGFHRLDLEEINGDLYVFGAGYGLGRVEILRFDPEPAPRLVLESVYQSPEARNPMDTKGRGSGPDSYSVHDVTVDPDPLTGLPLLAVAHWRAGAHFVDVADPANPRYLGQWDDFVDVLPGTVHNVEFTAIEGRRIAMAVPEYPGGHERQGIVWIVDITDFGSPRLHGTWSLPGHHPVEGGTYVYTTDRVLIRNGTVFVGHFHAGAIVLDASTLEKAAAPELLGWIVPPAADPVVVYMGITTNPLVYDVVPYGRHLLYTDLTGKFHVAEMAPELAPGRTW